MMDKRVVDYDSNFRGIRVGDLVRPIKSVEFLNWKEKEIGLVLDRTLNAMMLGEGDAESYDPMLTVVVRGRRYQVYAGDVEKVKEDP
jgi:hypothetical protein